MLRLVFAAILIVSHASAEFPPATFPEDEETPVPSKPDEYLSPKMRREQPPPPPPKPVRRDPVIKQRIPEEAPASGPSDFRMQVRLAAFGGYSNLGSASATYDNTYGLYNLKDQFGWGAMGDWRVTRLFAAEAEFFMSGTLLQTIDLASGTEERQMSSLGALMGLRLEVPWKISLGMVRPRLSAGYGMVDLDQFSSNASGEGHKIIRVSGPYVAAGVEWERDAKLGFFGDVAFSLGAAGQYVTNGVGGASSAVINYPTFLRIRLGGSYRVWGPMSLGVLVAYRSINTNVTPSGALIIGQGERFLQGLGTVTVTF